MVREEESGRKNGGGKGMMGKGGRRVETEMGTEVGTKVKTGKFFAVRGVT